MIFRVSSLSRVSQNAEARIVFDDEIERNQVSWKSSKTRTHYLKNHKSCNRRKQRQPRSFKDSSEAHYRDRKTDRQTEIQTEIQRYRQRYKHRYRQIYRETEIQRHTATERHTHTHAERPGQAWKSRVASTYESRFWTWLRTNRGASGGCGMLGQAWTRADSTAEPEARRRDTDTTKKKKKAIETEMLSWPRIPLTRQKPM